jgi:hypothetical protein
MLFFLCGAGWVLSLMFLVGYSFKFKKRQLIDPIYFEKDDIENG